MRSNSGRKAAVAALLFGGTLGASSASGAILWDQLTTAVPTGVSLSSQQFEAAYAAYNNISIDDFTLGANSTITSVDFSFLYFNGPGPVANWRVEIFSSPAAAVAAGPALVGDVFDSGFLPGGQPATGAPAFLSLPVNIPLAAGSYWIGIQGVMDFAAGGQIALQNQNPITGAEGFFANPGGGFVVPGNGAPFSVLNGGTAADVIFRLNGEIPAPGAAALLGLGGLIAARRRRA